MKYTVCMFYGYSGYLQGHGYSAMCHSATMAVVDVDTAGSSLGEQIDKVRQLCHAKLVLSEGFGQGLPESMRVQLVGLLHVFVP